MFCRDSIFSFKWSQSWPFENTYSQLFDIQNQIRRNFFYNIYQQIQTFNIINVHQVPPKSETISWVYSLMDWNTTWRCVFFKSLLIFLSYFMYIYVCHSHWPTTKRWNESREGMINRKKKKKIKCCFILLSVHYNKINCLYLSVYYYYYLP